MFKDSGEGCGAEMPWEVTVFIYFSNSAKRTNNVSCIWQSWHMKNILENENLYQDENLMTF